MEKISNETRVFAKLPCALKKEIMSDLARGNFEAAKDKYDAWKLRKSSFESGVSDTATVSLGD